MRTIFMVCAASTLLCYQARSQESELTEYLKAGQADANKLIGAYVSPVVEGLSYGLNGGWYHTAKAHKTLGFDIGVSVQAVFIPTSKNFFNPADLKLSTIELVPANGQSPTIVGPDSKPTYRFTDPNAQGATFTGPEGLDLKGNVGFNAVPAATAQIGIGIWKNTEIKFRYLPEVEASDTKVKLIGFGLLHDIKQHIPGIKLMPFDLSVVVGYTRFNGVTGLAGSFNNGGDNRPQQMEYQMNAWLFQALISKKLSVVTFYGGIGYNTINTNVAVTGSYVVTEVSQQPWKDPFAANYKQKSLRATAGVRFKFGPIYLNGDYSLQEYSTLSVGLGVSVR
jgi:hypothetical protein